MAETGNTEDADEIAIRGETALVTINTSVMAETMTNRVALAIAQKLLRRFKEGRLSPLVNSPAPP